MTKRAILWGKPAGKCGALLSAMGAGAARLGYDVVWRCPGMFGEAERADLCALVGQKPPEERVTDVYRELGVPVLIGEKGFVRRGETYDDPAGYYQIGPQIGWTPPGTFATDRWHALGMPILPWRKHGEGGYILALGQVPEDRQHRLSQPVLMGRLRRLVAMAEGKWPGLPVVYRPHPEAPDCGFELGTVQTGTLDDALSGAAVAVTVNSTAGIEALRHGVPVVCDPMASYFDVSDRERYFSRLANAQWTLAEIATGSPMAFVLEAGYG